MGAVGDNDQSKYTGRPIRTPDQPTDERSRTSAGPVQLALPANQDCLPAIIRAVRKTGCKQGEKYCHRNKLPANAVRGRSKNALLRPRAVRALIVTTYYCPNALGGFPTSLALQTKTPCLRRGRAPDRPKAGKTKRSRNDRVSDYRGRMSAAWGPFGPSLTSNSTSWPSFRLR